jgi:hypothetical protein
MSFTPINLGQSADTGNTKDITLADASPSSAWVGTFFKTRDDNFVRQLVTISSLITSGLGGTVTYEYSEDGINPTTTQDVTISDFSNSRYLDLINAGGYFRIQFKPSRILTSGEIIYITTTQRRQNDGSFTQPGVKQIEESSSTLSNSFAINRGVRKDGTTTNIRATELDALTVSLDNVIVSEAGSVFTEGIRDDISRIFSRDKVIGALDSIIDNDSINGIKTPILLQGQAEFSVPAITGSIAYYESISAIIYEAGHVMVYEQTIELPIQPIGDGKIEWGMGESSGSLIDNAVGFGYDAVGLYTYRIKNGLYESKVYQEDFNIDKLDGNQSSRFLLNGVPTPINVSNNNIYQGFLEWFGVASPKYLVVTPLGNPIEVHIEQTTGQQTGSTVAEPELKVFIRIQNDSTTGQALSLRTGCWKGGLFTNKPAGTLISSVNSHDGVLAANATFSGSFESILAYAQLDVTSFSDVDGTLYIDLSSDGTNTLFTGTFPTISGAVLLKSPFPTSHMRLRYTNGPIAQTRWNLRVLLRSTNPGITALPIESSTFSLTTAQTVRAMVGAKSNSGQYTNTHYGQQDMTGSLPVVLASNQPAILVTGSMDINNFPSIQIITGSVIANAGTNLNTSNLDVALSTRLKPSDTLNKVTTVDTITNVVHVDDNAGSITVDQGPSGSINWKVVEANSAAIKTDVDYLPLIKAKTDNIDVLLSTVIRNMDSGVSVTAAVNTAVTATLPAVAGKFHLISQIEILSYATANKSGTSTPLLVTSSNLPGNPTFTLGTVGGIGSVDRLLMMPTMPIKSVTVNTATTIVCPATANTIWRINIFYTTAS